MASDLDQKLQALDKSLADLRSFMAGGVMGGAGSAGSGSSGAASAGGGSSFGSAVKPRPTAPAADGIYVSPFAATNGRAEVSFASAGSSSSRGGPSEAQLIRVAKVVENTTGIMLSGRLYDKLANALAKVGASEHVEQWIVGYEVMADRHPAHLDLVEQLTVHETYFYRDERQLEQFRRDLLPAMIRKRIAEGRMTLRLWSAACSTGEEAYTLAIIVSDVLATLATDPKIGRQAAAMNVEVLGTDISRQALARAEQAVYRTEGLGSFRNAPDYILSHFNKTTLREGMRIIEELRVLPNIRQAVRFKHFNLLSGAPPERDFDFIFCRNVLIYMNDANRLQVFRMLQRAMATNGMVLFGPTDSLKGAEIFRLHQVDGLSYYTRD